MKVGIITFHKTKNYGACLQALALQVTLEKLGAEVSIVDYMPEIIQQTYTNFSLKKYHRVLKKSPVKALRILASDVIYCVPNHKLNKAFQLFYQKYYKLSPRRYRTYTELQSNPPTLDCCFTGSDQVWNCDITNGYDPAFFLEFGQPSMIRASYAASMGREKLSDSEKIDFTKHLSGLEHISLRESAAATVVSAISNVKACVSCDPTLLLSAEEWRNLFGLNDKPKEKYIFVYKLYQNPELDKVVKLLAKKTGYKIVSIGNRAVYDNEVVIKDADPAKFVALVSGAEFIVTNSFHGTAFSVNFNKPFYCVLGESRNSRMLGFLEKIQMEIRAKKQFSNEEIEAVTVDYTAAQQCLEQMREESKKYICKCVEVKQHD
ncbi:MAG: polysaccharide pyruvyl transferase family protein [Parabacteroides sp.]|nr:polysaccharide pyruvyl transferase family protein [Parabacteroides sp.]